MNRKIIFLSAIAGAVLLSVTLTTAVLRSSTNNKTSRNEVKPAPVKPPPDLPKVISLRLTRNGFEPAQLTVPAGQYLLAVHNRTELKSLELRLDRQAGPRLKQHKMDLQKLNWQTDVKLTPGRYVLAAAEDPRWVCEITVTTP